MANAEPQTLTGLYARNFVGRDAELQLLKQLVDERRPVISITGRTGIGKTALVAKFLTDNELAHNWTNASSNPDSLGFLQFLLDKELPTYHPSSSEVLVLDGVDSVPPPHLISFIDAARKKTSITSVILTSQNSLSEFLPLTELPLRPLGQQDYVEWLSPFPIEKR